VLVALQYVRDDRRRGAARARARFRSLRRWGYPLHLPGLRPAIDAEALNVTIPMLEHVQAMFVAAAPQGTRIGIVAIDAPTAPRAAVARLRAFVGR
jgi:hypothetical protein